jgi:hypothetical protein
MGVSERITVRLRMKIAEGTPAEIRGPRVIEVPGAARRAR